MLFGVSISKIKRYACIMKYILSIILAAVLLCTSFTCDAKAKSGSSATEEAIDKDASYALGMDIGSWLKTNNFHPDMKEFNQGINDTLLDVQTRFTMEEAGQILNEAFNALREKQEIAKRQEETDFLAENSAKPGINITGSGLQYEVITEGNGPKPGATDTVRVHYEGALTDGTVFDSSYNRGEPIEFPLNGVIPGWTEGLQLMGVGSKYRLFIPSDLGYGPRGDGYQIPPYSALVFEVELLDIIQKD
jgi:FKBP-type peptidyl-prolyl cis-trans isomerase